MVVGATIAVAPINSASAVQHSSVGSPAPRASSAARASLSASPQSLYERESVKFTGTLVRGKLNQKAVLQVWRDGSWRGTGDYDSTNRRGKFVISHVMDYEPGAHRFRVMGKRSRLYDVPQVVTNKVRIAVKDKPGSQSLPWRPNQWFTVEDWQFAFNPTITDAWPIVRSQSEYADAPPPGWSYVTVALGFVRTGPGSGRAWIENDLAFVGGDGVVYSGGQDLNGDYVYCSLNNDWSDAPELYTGARSSGTECLPVPTAAIAGGAWRLSGGYDDEDQWITLN